MTTYSSANPRPARDPRHNFSPRTTKGSRLMCTLCSTPTRPFVGPGRLLAGVGASAGCADELRALGVLPTDGPVLLVADSAVLDLGLHRAAVSAARGRRLTRSCVGPGISAEPTPDDRAVAAPDRWRSQWQRSSPSAEEVPSTRPSWSRSRSRTPSTSPPGCPPRPTSCPARRSSPYRRRPERAPRRPRSPCSGTTAGSGCSSTPISSRAACSSIRSCCSGCRHR